MKNWIKEHKKRVIAIAVVIVLIIIGIFSCTRSSGDEQTQQTVAQVEKRTLMESVSATGNVMASDEFEVKSKANGVEVLSVNVEVGDMVSQGQIICTMDAKDLQERLDDTLENQNNQNKNDSQSRQTAADNLKTAESNRNESLQEIADNVAKAESDYNYAVSTYETSKASYETILASTVDAEHPNGDENDAKVLAAKNQMISDEQAMNNAKTRYDNQVNRRATNEQRVWDTYNTAVDNYNNTIENLDGREDNYGDSIKDLQEQIADCTVVAPVSGMITSLNVTVGDNFNGSVVAVIDNVDALDVVTEIDEYDINRVQEGQKVIIKTNATGDEELSGVVKKVSKIATNATTYSDGNGSGSSFSGGGFDFDLGSIADASSFGSSSSSGSKDVTFTVKIAMDKLDERLRIGMTAKLSIITQENEDVICVPFNAIQTEDDGKTFFVNQITGTDEETGEYITKQVSVSKGIESDYYTEILGGGVKVGDEILMPEVERANTLEDMINQSSSMGGVN